MLSLQTLRWDYWTLNPLPTSATPTWPQRPCFHSARPDHDPDPDPDTDPDPGA